MVGGEIFVPKIPSMNIMDLAMAIAPQCRIEIVGIRPGEKLHEVIISKDDARRTLEFENHYTIQPDFKFWERRYDNSGKPVSEEFEYNSATNPWQLSIEDMRKIINTL
jgi:UDP-N-acetylglucosamine 4,6-dehydratase